MDMTLREQLADRCMDYVVDAVNGRAIENTNRLVHSLRQFILSITPEYNTREKNEPTGQLETTIFLDDGSTITLGVHKWTDHVPRTLHLEVTLPDGTNLPAMDITRNPLGIFGLRQGELPTIKFLALIDFQSQVVAIDGPDFVTSIADFIYSGGLTIEGLSDDEVDKEEVLGQVGAGDADAVVKEAIDDRDSFWPNIEKWVADNMAVRIWNTFGEKKMDAWKLLPLIDDLETEDSGWELRSVADSNLPTIYLENGDRLTLGTLTKEAFIHDRILVVSYLNRGGEYLGSVKIEMNIENSKHRSTCAKVTWLDVPGRDNLHQIINLLAKVGFENRIDKRQTANVMSLAEVNTRAFMKVMGVSQSDQDLAIASFDSGGSALSKLEEITDWERLSEIFTDEEVGEYFLELSADDGPFTMDDVRFAITESLQVLSVFVSDAATFDIAGVMFMLEDHAPMIPQILKLLIDSGLLLDHGGGKYEFLAKAKAKLEVLGDEYDARQGGHEDEDEDFGLEI